MGACNDLVISCVPPRQERDQAVALVDPPLHLSPVTTSQPNASMSGKTRARIQRGSRSL
jgi:hypothetical protein